MLRLGQTRKVEAVHASARAQGITAFLALANLPLVFAALFPSRILVPVSAADLAGALPAFVILGGLGWIGVMLATREAAAVRLYVQAFAIRLPVAIALAFAFQFDDERALHESAVGGFGGGYVKLLALVYRIFGPNLLVAKALNVAIGSLLVVVVARIPNTEAGRRLAGRLAVLAPPLVVYSAVNLKEMATAFLFTLLVHGAIRAQGGEASLARSAAGVAGALVALGWLRGVGWLALAGGALAGGLAAQLVWAQRKMPGGYRAVAAGALLIGVLVFGPRLARAVTDQYVTPRAAPEATTSYFVDRAFAADAGITRYLRPGEPLGPRNLAALWARGLYVPTPLRFLVSPSGALAVEAAGALGWYALLLAGAAGFGGARREPVPTFLLAAAVTASVGTTALVALGADPIRHRVILIPILCLLAAETVKSPRGVLGAQLGRAGVILGALAYNIAWLFAVGLRP